MLLKEIGVKSNSNSPVYMNLIVYYNKDYYHNIPPNYPNNEHLIQITLFFTPSNTFLLTNNHMLSFTKQVTIQVPCIVPKQILLFQNDHKKQFL